MPATDRPDADRPAADRPVADHPATDRSARPAEVARSLIYYALFYGGSVIIVLMATFTLPLPPAVSRAIVRWWSDWHRWCCRHLLQITVVIEGTLPDYPVLFAMRHESFFEAIDLPHLIGAPMVFTKAELLRIPLWGRLGRRYGLIGVDREAGARSLRAMIAAAKVNRAQGPAMRPMVIFPEGTRVPHGTAPPLQAGFAGIYKIIALPVVPIAVDSGPLYHRRWKRAGTVHYRIGAQIVPGLPRETIEAAVHRAINALNDQPG